MRGLVNGGGEQQRRTVSTPLLLANPLPNHRSMETNTAIYTANGMKRMQMVTVVQAGAS